MNESFSDNKSYISKYSERRPIENVGFLNNISIDAITKEQNLDELEHLSLVCDRMILNPMWHAHQSACNKRKLLEIFQTSIKYANEVDKIYQNEIIESQARNEQAKKKNKDRKKKMMNHKEKVSKKKEKIKLAKLQIERDRTNNCYHKLLKMQEFINNEKSKENSPQQPQYIYVQQPPMQPYQYQPQQFYPQPPPFNAQNQQPPPNFNPFQQLISPININENAEPQKNLKQSENRKEQMLQIESRYFEEPEQLNNIKKSVRFKGDFEEKNDQVIISQTHSRNAVNFESQRNFKNKEEQENEQIKRQTSLILKRHTKQKKSTMQESVVAISQGTSERLDDVFELEPISHFQKGQKQPHRKDSNISTNSVTTDYDLGSIMDMNLKQQSRNSFENKPSSSIKKKTSVQIDIEPHEFKENSFLLKSNQGRNAGEKKFLNKHITVNENSDEIEKNLSENEDENSNQSNLLKPYKQEYDYMKGSNQNGKDLNQSPFEGKKLEIKKSFVAGCDEKGLKNDSIMEEDDQDNYDDDFQPESPKITISTPKSQIRSSHRFAALLNKAFTLKNHAIYDQSPVSLGEIGSLREISTILQSRRKKTVKMSKDLKQSGKASDDVDFDMMELPQHSMIAKPSRLKQSTLKKSSALLKKSEKKVRLLKPPLSNTLSPKNKGIEEGDENFIKLGGIKTKVIKKQTDEKNDKIENDRDKRKKELEKNFEVESAESVVIENGGIKGCFEEENAQIIMEELGQSSDLQTKEKRKMEEKMIRLIKNRFNQPNKDKKFEMEILKQEISKNIKNIDLDDFSFKDVNDIFDKKLEKQREKIANRREQLIKKQKEGEQVRFMTTGKRISKETKEDDLTYSISLFEGSQAKAEKPKEQTQKPVEQDDKKQSKFAVESKKVGNMQMASIQEKMNLNYDDEVEDAVRREMNKKLSESEDSF